MIKATILSGVASAALMTSACTTQIATMPDTVRTAPNGAIAGIPYNLPMLQYRIEATRTLAQCPTTLIIADATGKPTPFVDPTLAFAVTVAAKPRYVRGETYVVDYRSLSSILKQTSFGITTYPETQNLRTINLSAEDKTGDVLKNVAELGLTVAGLAAGGPAAGAAKGVPDTGGGAGAAGILKFSKPRPQRAADDAKLFEIAAAASGDTTFLDCAPAAKAAFKQREAAAGALRQATSAATRASADLRTQAVVAALDDMPGAARERQATKLAALMAAHDEATQTLTAAVTAKAEANATLSRTNSRIWPERIDDRAALLQDVDTVTTTVGPLLSRTPTRARALNMRAFSQALAKLREVDRERFDRLAKRYGFLLGYADRGLAPDSVWTAAEAASPAACTVGDPALDVAQCLKETLPLAVRLDTVEMNGGKFIDGAGCTTRFFPTLECRKELGIPTTPANGRAVKPKSGEPEVVNAREVGPAGIPHAKGGLFVRQAVPGRLMVCRAAACDANTSVNLFAIDPDAPPTYAPQLGQLRYLPFRNSTFQSNELGLELAPDGTIAKFEYKDKAATAAVLTATAADVAKQIDDARTKRREDSAKAETQAVASLQAQIDTIEKQAKLNALRISAAETPEQAAAKSLLADLQADKVLLTAQYDKRKVYNDLVAVGGMPAVEP